MASLSSSLSCILTTLHLHVPYRGLPVSACRVDCFANESRYRTDRLRKAGAFILILLCANVAAHSSSTRYHTICPLIPLNKQ
ncbi:hypothetical protein M440DRAFT_1072598 [Trichoderma longibrachiatum ATCC 18648]|uniref:Uncharacterized protein n=1 Tax=Trichoderma longibrachiatum ATCC 18648 TaxID=983965 RepID=A0A2T4BUV2_TRILO|nr:hypothetical protein M440DRAFT_1072598 [Trichoderma longibrachiatum ATCC 18648]